MNRERFMMTPIDSAGSGEQESGNEKRINTNENAAVLELVSKDIPLSAVSGKYDTSTLGEFVEIDYYKGDHDDPDTEETSFDVYSLVNNRFFSPIQAEMAKQYESVDESFFTNKSQIIKIIQEKKIPFERGRQHVFPYLDTTTGKKFQMIAAFIKEEKWILQCMSEENDSGFPRDSWYIAQSPKTRIQR